MGAFIHGKGALGTFNYPQHVLRLQKDRQI